MLPEEIPPAWSATQTRASLGHHRCQWLLQDFGHSKCKHLCHFLCCFHASQPAPPPGSLSPSSHTQHVMVGRDIPWSDSQEVPEHLCVLVSKARTASPQLRQAREELVASHPRTKAFVPCPAQMDCCVCIHQRAEIIPPHSIQRKRRREGRL